MKQFINIVCHKDSGRYTKVCGDFERTYSILKAEQHHLQAAHRYSGRDQCFSEVQQAAGQLLPIWGADVVSEAFDELCDVVCGEIWSISVLRGIIGGNER